MTTLGQTPHGLRQIHLDFHTSRDFDRVAADFDAAEFARVMDDAAVSSVNVFAKCHHGYSYYPTSVATVHPGLSGDLLGAQIAALHERGIDAPIYVSVLWDDFAAEAHPEWVVTNRFGRQSIRTPLTSDSPLKNQRGWSTMDIASGYGEHVLAQLSELIDRYPVDGFWLDIVWVEPNYSPAAQLRMRNDGIDMSDEQAVYDYARRGLLDWMGRVQRLLAERAPGATLYFNGMMDADAAEAVALQAHVEVESLPTSGGVWGYMHYPVISRFARTFEKPMIGMTGRFHRSWADFGGLKPVAQLNYESGTILAAGGGISIGDQLDPDGRLDEAVYRTIGAEFRRIRDLEPWLASAQPIREAAIVGSAHVSTDGVHLEAEFVAGVEGAVQLANELNLQVDITRGVPDGSHSYALLIVPEGVELDDAGWRALGAAADGGAAVLFGPAAAEAALATEFAPRLPIAAIRSTGVDQNYLVAGERLAAEGELDAGYPYAIYGAASALDVRADAEAFGSVRPARFSRTWARFTSHAHTPVAPDAVGPLAAVRGRVAVLAAPLFELHRSENYWVYPVVVDAVLRQVHPDRVVQRVAYGQVEVSVHERPETGDHLLHLVPFHAKRGFSSVPRLDSALPLADFAVTLRLPASATSATLLPSGEALPIVARDGDVEVVIPRLLGHTVVHLA